MSGEVQVYDEANPFGSTEAPQSAQKTPHQLRWSTFVTFKVRNKVQPVLDSDSQTKWCIVNVARMDTNRLRWGGVTYRSLEEIRRGRCRHSEVKSPIIVGLQLHRQLQPFLVLCGSSIEQLAEIHQVDTSLPCDRKPQLRFGCRALRFGWCRLTRQMWYYSITQTVKCSATESDRRWAVSRTECWADRRGGGGFARWHTHLDLLDEHSGRHARFFGQPDRQVTSTIQGRFPNHSALVCKVSLPARKTTHSVHGKKSVEEQWSQWTARELWCVECETQSLRH